MAALGNPYEETRIEQDLIDPDDAQLDDLDDPLDTRDTAPLTGNIGQPAGSSRSQPLPQGYLNQQIGGEDRRAPINTIDESVWDTLRRDLLASWQKMQLVLWPKHLLGGILNRDGGLAGAEAGNAGLGSYNEVAQGIRGIAGRVTDADALLSGAVNEQLRDWDLWGPLIFSLLLSMLLSFTARPEQSENVFTGVFSLVWVGSTVVTWQIRLLGGKIAFFQTVCIIGYTLFPIVIAALLSAVRVKWFIRIPVYAVLLLWSLAAGISILGGSGVVKNRVGLAVYPLFVFYLGLGVLCFIS